MWLVVSVVVVVVAVATYLTWVAARVDRLHARAAAAYSALDAHSMRRAAAAADLGDRFALPEVQTAAKQVLAAPAEERATAENDLTALLRGAVGTPVRVGDGDEVVAVIETSRRLGLARQVHTDQTRDARNVRRHPLVRLLGLARKYEAPDQGMPTLDDGDLRSR